MEVPALQGMTIERGLLTMEKPALKSEQHKSLRIGIPREVSNEERRVSLAPSGISTLVGNGREVFIEKQAGAQAHFSDEAYIEAGAEVMEDPADVYSRCELIVKVGPPCDEEWGLLQEEQILISALHLGGTSPEFLRRLMDLGITGIGFEFIRGYSAAQR